MARPKKYDPVELAAQLNEFIDSETDPLLQAFCLPVDRPCRDTLHRLSEGCQELSDAIKRAMAKQELHIINKAMSGDAPPAFAIFRLKQPQHGWTDKQQIDQTVNAVIDDVTKLTPEQRQSRITELLSRYQK